MSVSASERGAAWLLKEMWDLGGRPPIEDYTAYMKSLLICANGEGTLSPAEREWVLGYCAALGAPPELMEELASYPADEDVAEVIARGRLADSTGRATVVFDAIRACDADGDLVAGEMQQITTMATRLGVADMVEPLIELYRREKEVRGERIKLLYPSGPPV
jgi:hypothetical protein